MVQHASELSRQCWVSSSAVLIGFITFPFSWSVPQILEVVCPWKMMTWTHVDVKGMTLGCIPVSGNSHPLRQWLMQTLGREGSH